MLNQSSSTVSQGVFVTNTLNDIKYSLWLN